MGRWMSAEKKEEIVNLGKGGMTTDRIASRLCISKEVVKLYLKRAHVKPLRDKWGLSIIYSQLQGSRKRGG